MSWLGVDRPSYIAMLHTCITIVFSLTILNNNCRQSLDKHPAVSDAQLYIKLDMQRCREIGDIE